MYDLGTCVCQETFPFSFETFIDNISYDGVEDGVTQKLQSLVVQRTSLLGADGRLLMQERLFVDLDIVRIKSEYPVKTKIRLSIPVEQEPYLIYLVS